MGKPAARLLDMHVCPMVTPAVVPIPHVGGPILAMSAPTVLIGGLPAATVGDMCICVGPPDTIILGSLGVLICKKAAARMGDQTAHGGTIVLGLPTVLIGDTAIADLLAFINSSNSVINCGFIIDEVINLLQGRDISPASAQSDGSFGAIDARHGTNTNFSNPTNFNAVFSQLQASGPGSMQIVGINYSTGGAHVVVAANINGQVGIMEGQNWGPGQGRGFITDPAVANARYNPGGGSTIAASPVPRR